MNRRHVLQSRAGRRGFTLVELLTVISVLTAVMIVGTRLLILLMNLHTAAGIDLAQRETVQRLEGYLRRDLRQATDFTLPTDDQRPQILTIVLPTAAEVRYHFDGNGAVREALAANVPQREVFPLPHRRFGFHRQGGNVHCVIDRESDVPMEDQYQSPERTSRFVEIVVAAGLHLPESADELEKEAP